MQVQKGLVKYKDRSDILCTYGITEEGKTYYFLEGNTIPNGNIVATTVLVEAIDPLVMSSSIGVIDPNGAVVIPFENKAIKTIANDLLLVEKATPVTESVIEAIELRSDPQAASRLVTTPAVIKENMNAKMGPEGRFVFNDQFSEATICDMNGNNLVNNELYSFIGVTQDKLYLSKNTSESFVSEFSLEAKQLVLTPDMNDPMLKIGDGDASEYTVDLDTVQQNAMQATIDADVATAAAMNEAQAAMQQDEAMRNAPAEVPVAGVSDTVNTDGALNAAVPVENVVPAEGFVPAENVVSENSEQGFAASEVIENPESGFMPGDITADNFADVMLPSDMTTLGDDSESTEENVEEQDENSAEGNDEAPTEEEVVPETEPVPETTPEPEVPVEEETDESVKAVSSEEVAETVIDTDFKLDIEDREVESTPAVDLFSDYTSTDIFAGSSLRADRIVDDMDDVVEPVYSPRYDLSYLPERGSKENFTKRVGDTIAGLVDVNKTQRQKILLLEERTKQLEDANNSLMDKAREQARDYEKLKSSVENYRTVVGKLEAKIGVLESRNEALDTKARDQERTIYRLGEENKTLRSQNLNNAALTSVLEEANSLINGSSSSYEYEDMRYGRRRAA